MKKTFLRLSIFLVALCLFWGFALGLAYGEKKHRIISHLPSLTEICFELGLGDQLVGVSDYCNRPPEAKKLPRVGGLMNPNYERVVSLAPDMVLLRNTEKAIRRKYKSLGIPTTAVKADTPADVLDSIRTIGKTFHREDRAAKLVARIEGEFAKIGTRSAGRPPVSAMIVIGHEPGSLRDIYIASKGSFHSELLSMAGGRNGFEQGFSDYPKVSKEAVIARSPDVIIVCLPADSMTAEEIAREKALWSPLKTVAAVKNHRVCVLHGDYIMIPGPRMAKIAEEFSKCLREGNFRQP